MYIRQVELIMVKNLTRHGNSFAMVIDRAILELIGAKPETPFEIITDGNALVLTPVRAVEAERAFNESVQRGRGHISEAVKKQAEKTQAEKKWHDDDAKIAVSRSGAEAANPPEFD